MAPLRIVICAKEVPDPDAVNSYALAGRLVIGEDGRTLTQTSIPPLMNAYDEQAIEAALRMRDAGVQCTITCVSAGEDPGALLKHAAALGADEIVSLPLKAADADCAVVANLLAAAIRARGGADLVLCGRQASDDDQGVVPALLAESLGMTLVTIARAVSVVDGRDGPAVEVTRVTPDGDEVVECDCPAVVTISNELGQPRYPTAARAMAARRMQPSVFSTEDLGLSADDLRPRAELVRLFVPSVQGNCEFITGDSPAQVAERLMERLRAERLI